MDLTTSLLIKAFTTTTEEIFAELTVELGLSVSVEV